MSACPHREVAARPIIGDLGAGHTGSQAFCVACGTTVLHPGSPKQALQYFRNRVRARARERAEERLKTQHRIRPGTVERT